MDTAILDVGSSTVKAYQVTGGRVEFIANQSIAFKNGFDSEKGISESASNQLFEFFDKIQEKTKPAKMKVFATALFRKLHPTVRKQWTNHFFEKTKTVFHIIDHELENHYLYQAFAGKIATHEPVLLMNIGGGSTQLVILQNQNPIETINLDFGIGSIQSEFPTINESFAGVKLETVTQSIQEKLPSLTNKPVLAFHTGGEITYMRLTGYPLDKNRLFGDSDHPYTVGIHGFSNRNKQIFEETTLAQLENSMPQDPTWMHGARGCSALAQAICQKYGILTIVPSDSNIVHGIARQELRNVTISGSYRKYLPEIIELKKNLENKKINVLSPRFVKPKNPGELFVTFDGEENQTPIQLEEYHLKSIGQSDALVVCNPSGYVGASALFEVGYAHAKNKKIIFTEKPGEFLLNYIPHQVGL